MIDRETIIKIIELTTHSTDDGSIWGNDFPIYNNINDLVSDIQDIINDGNNISSFDSYFIKICDFIKLKSKDNNTKIGSIIVGEDNQIISSGYNSFPRGINDNVKERQLRPEKYYWFSHAETNAIINCALNGVSTKNSTMYMSCGLPCADCSRNIINAGIKKIYCKSNQNTMANKSKWEDQEIRSKQMLSESGVEVIYYE